MEKDYTLITGATSDIGISMVCSLSNEYPLIIHGRNEEKLSKIMDCIGSSKVHKIWKYDLNDMDGLKKSLLNLLETNNIFISNIIHMAGVTNYFPVHMLGYKNLLNSFKVNYFSFAEIISLLTKKKFKQHLASIIAVSSAACHGISGQGMASYISSKAALEIYCKTISRDIAPARINSIAFGEIESKKHDYVNVNLQNLHALGLGNTVDAVNMIEFLLSQKSRWITGQTFIVDGGYTSSYFS